MGFNKPSPVVCNCYRRPFWIYIYIYILGGRRHERKQPHSSVGLKLPSRVQLPSSFVMRSTRRVDQRKKLPHSSVGFKTSPVVCSNYPHKPAKRSLAFPSSFFLCFSPAQLSMLFCWCQLALLFAWKICPKQKRNTKITTHTYIQIKKQKAQEQAAANFATVVQKPRSVLNRER